jgi:hypothetical protein
VPIYVGQTANIAKRFASHVRQALAPGNPPASVYACMAEIIAAGQMPIFRVLEVHQTRAGALLAETVWAQRLLRDGARLCNQWPEQAQRLPAQDVARRQQVRLRNLTLAEGAEAGVFLSVRCRKKCWSAPLPQRTSCPDSAKRPHFTPCERRRGIVHAAAIWCSMTS